MGKLGGMGREVRGPNLMGVEPGHSKESEAKPPDDWLNVGAKGAGRIKNVFSHLFLDFPSPEVKM